MLLGLLQIADEWAALAKDDDVPDELDPDLQQSINEVPSLLLMILA